MCQPILSCGNHTLHKCCVGFALHPCLLYPPNVDTLTLAHTFVKSIQLPAIIIISHLVMQATVRATIASTGKVDAFGQGSTAADLSISFNAYVGYTFFGMSGKAAEYDLKLAGSEWLALCVNVGW